MTFTGIKRMPSKTDGNPDCPFQICIGMSLKDIEVWQNCIEHMNRVGCSEFEFECIAAKNESTIIQILIGFCSFLKLLFFFEHLQSATDKIGGQL